MLLCDTHSLHIDQVKCSLGLKLFSKYNTYNAFVESSLSKEMRNIERDTRYAKTRYANVTWRAPYISYDFVLKFKSFIANFRKRYIQRFFNDFDLNKDGNVSVEEIKEVLSRCNLVDDDVETLVLLHDKNKDGKLQYEEFVRFIVDGSEWSCLLIKGVFLQNFLISIQSYIRFSDV